MPQEATLKSIEERLLALEQEVARYRKLENLFVDAFRTMGYTVSSEKAPPDSPSAVLQAPKIKVLLMEDDDMIRSITGQKLRRLGYRTEFAEDGESALHQYKTAHQRGAPFDVVILDLMIEGGMGGREVIQALQAFDPHIRAIVSTGYINDPIMSNIHEHGFKAAVNKPFTVQQLEAAIAQALKD